jgi:hypothetical protein
MPRDAAPTAAVHPSKVLKLFGSLGALPRNPRTMLTYDASLAWTAFCCSPSASSWCIRRRS